VHEELLLGFSLVSNRTERKGETSRDTDRQIKRTEREADSRAAQQGKMDRSASRWRKKWFVCFCRKEGREEKETVHGFRLLFSMPIRLFSFFVSFLRD